MLPPGLCLCGWPPQLNLIYRKELDGVKSITQRFLRYDSGIRVFMGEIPVSNVATLMKRLDLTQRQLADLVGVTETTIRNWENNRSGIDWFERVAKLCDALECHPSDLYKMKDVSADDK